MFALLLFLDSQYKTESWNFNHVLYFSIYNYDSYKTEIPKRFIRCLKFQYAYFMENLKKKRANGI
jgi:hypothetical protein